MAEIRALDVPLDEDLRELSLYWWQQGIAHRIGEQAGRQAIWVGSEADAMRIRDSHRRWQDRQLEMRPPDLWLAMPRQRRRLPMLPVTLGGIALSVIGYLLVQFGQQLPWLDQFTFFAPWWNGSEWIAVFRPEQFWRLLTPVFLHFSLLHIVFNMLWYWDLGGRIERQQGPWRLLWIAVVIGVGSNFAQAIHTPGGLFGGMSGVIYGLLGYCWLWGRLRRSRELAIPRPVMMVMIAWLLICMVGFTEVMGLGAVANAAHLAGLLIGLALGALTALLSREEGARR